MNNTQTNPNSLFNYDQLKAILTFNEYEVYCFMKQHPNTYLLAYEWFVMMHKAGYKFAKTINSVAPRISGLLNKGFITSKTSEHSHLISNERGELIEINKRADRYAYITPFQETLF